jgi:hypothetical protein
LIGGGAGGLLLGGGGSGAGGLVGNGNTSGGGGRTCGGDTYQAEPSQLDLYVMFDDSGSMIVWWPGVTSVFSQFLDDPASAGIGAGIQFFGSGCDVNVYATPRVPIAPLPGNAAAIKAAFPVLPVEGTATDPALKGAIQQARTWKSQNQSHKVAVLLVTDGIPSECNSTVQSVSDIAAEGLSGNPSVQTFVLGLGFNLDPLNQIAKAGGTNQAVLADPNNAQALAQAMSQIRGAALPCDYAIPNAGNVDTSKVNIEFTADDGSTSTVPNVGDASRCDATTGGWYYDDPANPGRLVACPATCGTFKGTVKGGVNVAIGCTTVVK